MYSKEDCLLECRAKHQMKICGCKLLYMPGNENICNWEQAKHCQAIIQFPPNDSCKYLCYSLIGELTNRIFLRRIKDNTFYLDKTTIDTCMYWFRESAMENFVDRINNILFLYIDFVICSVEVDI